MSRSSSEDRGGGEGGHGQQDKPLWSLRVTPAEIPETGRTVVMTADEEVRRAVARAADVDGISRLEATFDLARYGRAGLRVTGEVSASVEQTCVVTLEPLRNEIREPVELLFVPPDELPEPAAATAGSDEAADAEDPPEPLENGAADLGAIATEFLVLGIDPYPRKPGASFESPGPGQDPADRPFAALAALKTPRNGGKD